MSQGGKIVSKWRVLKRKWEYTLEKNESKRLAYRYRIRFQKRTIGKIIDGENANAVFERITTPIRK